MNPQSVRALPAFFLGALLSGMALAAEAGGQAAETRPIVELPNPCRLAVIPHSFIGPDAEGKPAMVYVVLFQSEGGFSLVQINPADGTSRQWRADDEATNSYGYVVSGDGKIYIGSRGTFHRFDPTKPGKGLENLGRPAASEDWMWRIDEGTDGKIYGGTFPGAKLVSYDPATGVLTDHGTMHEGSNYASPLAAGKDGFIYVSVGTPTRSNVAAFKIADGTHRLVFPEFQGPAPRGEVEPFGRDHIFRAPDGVVYAVLGSGAYRLHNGAIEPVKMEDIPRPEPARMADGRELAAVDSLGRCTLVNPASGEKEKLRFKYSMGPTWIFTLAPGPGGKVLGGTIFPAAQFQYDPAERRSRLLGIPEPGGEIYSLLQADEWTYNGLYPNGKISRSQLGNPARVRHERLLHLGPSVHRPRTMVAMNGRLYVAGIGTNGLDTGGVGVLDLATGKHLHTQKEVLVGHGLRTAVALPEDKLLAFGTSVKKPGDQSPYSHPAALVLWDPEAKTAKLVRELPSKNHHVVAMERVGQRLFLLTADEHNEFAHPAGRRNLEVLDLATGEFAASAEFSYGAPIDLCLGLHRDGKLYGVSSKGVFRIDPGTLQVEPLADAPVPPSCGFVLNDTGIYFASNPRLFVYEWPESKTP